MKRLIDILVSFFGLILCLPVFLVVAFFIKLDSKGPVFFIQERVGKNGRLFKMIKFRTMVVNAAEIGPSLTYKNDMRITNVGSLLRWFKIDELPQLINVLKGEMSLIGPRPEVPSIVNKYQEKFRGILKVRAGVVGPSQILSRNEVSKYPDKVVDIQDYYEKVILPEKLAIDEKYVSKAGFWSDIKYLARGIWVTLFGVIKPGFILSRKSQLILILIDTTAILVAYILAASLRFEFDIPAKYWDVVLRVIPLLIPVTIIFLIYMGLYKKLWAFVETKSLVLIVKATLSSTVFMFVVLFFWGIRNHPRSIMLIYFLLITNFMIITRLLIRAVRGRRYPAEHKEIHKNAIIVGINEDSPGIIYHLLHDRTLKKKFIGFVDNDEKYSGMTIEGLKILGKIYDIPQILTTFNVLEVLVLSASVTPAELQSIYQFCRKTDAKVRIVPTIGDLIDGSVHVSKARDLEITDLLGREPVKLDLSNIRQLITGKKVLVSGAGGSIGSELCRQIAQFEPARLILIDKAENYLFDILLDLKTIYSDQELSEYNTSITNQRKLEYIFARERPDLVFHAAAHKHVPMSENNPDEAVINNIQATRLLSLAAVKYDVQSFIMISSDKAVNPCNIMGATKRIAELYLKSLVKKHKTRFMIIRFGNVLGSHGSVVKIFQKQIEHGGPLNITDERMTRYFMTISEACQLVLQAAAIGESGNILVLDMGEPVKIIDLAYKMIKIYGLRPEKDIKIKVIGPRPGEKMFEEINFSEEEVISTRHDKIKTLKADSNDLGDIDEQISQLYRKALEFDNKGMKEVIRTIIPGYPDADIHPASGI